MDIKPIGKKWDFLFIVLLVGIGLLYSYYQVMFMRPWSVHQWRQCDCLSIALNYYYEGMHFFSPSIHFIGPSNHGNSCTSESPIIYYSAALLWKIFGYHEFIYRLMEICIGFTGLYFLFRLVKELLNDGIWAILVSLFLFSSPILAYYCSSFLSDVPAFSFALIAWYFFFRFYKDEKDKYFNISILFFLLAGLVKITAMLSFVPIVMVFLIEVFGRYKFKLDGRVFKKPLLQGILLLSVAVIITAWTEYAIYYNNKYTSYVFSTNILPIWNLSSDEIWQTVRLFYNALLPQFLNMPCLIGLFILLLFIMLFYKRINKFFLFLSVTVFIGSIIYIVLWFQVFKVHDYYLINLLIFIPIVLITFLCFLKKEYPLVFGSGKVKIMAALIVLFSIYYCASKTQIKYYSDYTFAKYSYILSKEDIDLTNWHNASYDASFRAFETVTPYLRSLGISRYDTVLSIPDYSFNISLYLMDEKGFTDAGSLDGGNGTGFCLNSIRHGAKYLIINDESFLQLDWIKPFIANPLGQYKNIHIFRVNTAMFDTLKK